MFRLNNSGLKALSSVSNSIAQVFFGAFIAAVVLPIERWKIPVLLLELGFAVVFWILSVRFAQKGKL